MIELEGEVEHWLVRFGAKKRIEHNRRVGAKATIYGNESAEKREIDSFGAEVAFCKLYNCWPDLDVLNHKPYDCILDGQTVDVKNTVHENGMLMAKAIERPEICEWYVLMIGEFPRYQFVGAMKGIDLFMGHRLETERWEFPAYCAKQNELVRRDR